MTRAGMVLLATIAALVLAATPAAGLRGHRYTLLVGNQGPGGDPGVLYVGGPANFTVYDKQEPGSPVRLCIYPAPIDQPNCRTGRTGQPISGPAFSRTGRTKVNFTVGDGPRVTRTIYVRSADAAQEAPGPYRIIAATAIFAGRNAALLMHLNRALPALGERRPPFRLGQGIHKNEVLPSDATFYGGLTPSRAGRRDRYCYVADAQRILPLHLQDGKRVKAAVGDGDRIAAITTVTLHHTRRDAHDRSLLRRIGC